MGTKRKRREFSDEQKARAVHKYRAGVGVAALSREMDVKPSVIYGWIKSAGPTRVGNETGPGTINPQFKGSTQGLDRPMKGGTMPTKTKGPQKASQGAGRGFSQGMLLGLSLTNLRLTTANFIADVNRAPPERTAVLQFVAEMEEYLDIVKRQA